MKQIASSGIGIALALGLAILPASAQNQASQNQASQNQASPSAQSSSTGSTGGGSNAGSALGDYARQIRKAPAAEPKTKVFDNDNLPRDDKLSIVGNATETPAASSTDATAAAPAPAGAAGETKAQTEATPIATSVTNPEKKQEEDDAAKQAAWKQWGEKIAAQKDQIDLVSRELDVLQREYKLRAAAMYADVGNRMRNSADWDKQDAQYKQQIADKQAALDAAKQKLDDMIEDARKAGVPASIREP